MGEQPDEPVTSRRVIADRYEVVEELGRGGAAVVYRVRDPLGERELALKQLSVERHGKRASDLAVLFQREFHTLAQLSHPRIIEVFDFGVEASGPYYTMELLSSGDLRSKAPLAWKEACRLLYDVCSSLALVHARRWVHRDVTPLNIRIADDGRAKLIDFGAMVPMGPCEHGVGTPPFTAPEVIQRSLLDARTDLFSVGATLYYLLTGQNAYPARSFAQLPLLWQQPPLPPSALTELPPGLDALVLSLLRPEPAARPASTFEVMQRLAALAGIVEDEAEGVSHAYLATPNLVGRDQVVRAIESALNAAVQQRGGSLLVYADGGLGRSRVLEACALKAKLSGVVLLRGRAGGAQDFALTQKLFAQLFETLPEQTLDACAAAGAAELLTKEDGAPALKALPTSDLSRLETHAKLVAWLCELAKRETLVIIVDDLEGVDEPSVVLLGGLASEAKSLRLLVMGTLDPGSDKAASCTALRVLRNTSTQLSLQPLTADHMLELARSVFGNVQHLGVVCDALVRVSAGRPRVAMELLQHLVNERRITYRAGQWTLPAALGEGELPRDAESALSRQIFALTALSRRLLEMQALASHEAFTREDYARVLEDLTAIDVNRALSELLALGLLISDGAVYRIAHRGLIAAALRDISDHARAEHHRLLANLYESSRGAEVLRHWLASGLELRAVERALSMVEGEADTQPILQASRMPASEICAVLVAILDIAEKRALSARGLNNLRRAICSLSTGADESHFFRVGPEWLAQLARDSGLTAYRALDPALDPAERLSQAMGAAGAAYLASPEAERVYQVPEAIRCLLHYAVAGIAIGSRSQDMALLESLPSLLAPFASISPIAHALCQNTLATCEAVCWARHDAAHARWLETYERLEQVDSAGMQRIEVVRRAVAYGIGSMAAHLGLASASDWADRIERDPRQGVNAFYLRRVIALQQGDGAAAEAFRQKAEIVALQASGRQMFGSSGAELPAYIAALDLVGVRQIIERLAPLARRFPGWRGYHRCAQGYFELLREDFAGAEHAFEEAIRLTDPAGPHAERHIGAWLLASAGLVETLIARGHYEQARALGLGVLAFCEQHSIHVASFAVARAVALAEAKQLNFAAATARIEGVISAQETLGVTGVYLGITYEVRARVAIATGAWDDVGKYAALAAREYRHGKGSLLAGRYERLMDEARKSIRGVAPVHAELALMSSVHGVFTTSGTKTLITQAFSGRLTAADRADAALALLCKESGAAAGHLFVNTESGFILAASRGANAQSALVEKVRAYLLEEHKPGEPKEALTETVHGLDGRFVVDGIPFAALSLACFLHGHVHSVGVLVLASGVEATLVLPNAALLEGVARKLLQTGDAVTAQSKV